MDWRDHIVATPDTLGGKPRLKGTRLGVALLLEKLAAGWTEQELLENYPTLTREGLRATLSYAAAFARKDRARPLAAHSR